MNNEDDLSKLTTEQWRQRLPDRLTFEVLRQRATEPPGSGKYIRHRTKGKYVCFACRADLFRSEDKIGHGGWPSFKKAMGTSACGSEAEANIRRIQENYDGEDHIEVQCKRCHSHLGYLYEDPTQAVARRFCINSVALDFVRDPGEEDPPSKSTSPVVKPTKSRRNTLRRHSSCDAGTSADHNVSPSASSVASKKSPCATRRPSQAS